MYYLIKGDINLMKLSDLKAIWGIDITNIKEENRKYLTVTTIIVIMDIILMGAMTYLLFSHNSDFQSYALIMFGLSFVAFFIYSYLANPTKHRVYKFYRRFKDCPLIEESFDIDEIRLYSLAYCIGFKRLKENKDFDYYKEAILNYCYEDYANSGKFYKYLSKYKSDSGEFVVYKVTKGKKSYFIDFKDSSYILSEREEV